MATRIPPSLHAHAAVQFGLVTRTQAMEELTSSALHRRQASPQIQLTVPPGRRSTRIVPPPHHVPLPALDVTRRWVIPTTTPARTIIDLSTRVPKPLLERVADDLIRRGHLKDRGEPATPGSR